MEFRVSFRNMDSSNALRAYAREKLEEKITKFVTKPIEAHVTFALEGIQHVVHLNVSAGDGFDVHLQEKAPMMYVAIDTLADTLEGQLKRHKEKLKAHHAKRGGLKALMENFEVVATDDTEAMAIDAADIIAEESRAQNLRSRV